MAGTSHIFAIEDARELTQTLTCPFKPDSIFHWDWINKKNWSLKAYTLRAVEYFEKAGKPVQYTMILNGMFKDSLPSTYIDPKTNKIKAKKIRSMVTRIKEWPRPLVKLLYVLRPSKSRATGAGRKDDIPYEVLNELHKIIDQKSEEEKAVYFDTIKQELVAMTDSFGIKVFESNKDKKKYEALQKRKRAIEASNDSDEGNENGMDMFGFN